MKKIISLLLLSFSLTTYAQLIPFAFVHKPVAVYTEDLLIPTGNYTPSNMTMTVPFNPSLGGGNVSFSGHATYGGTIDYTWSPHQLFNGAITNYEWCDGGVGPFFAELTLPRSVHLTKIFMMPRIQGDNFPTQVTLIIDGTTIGTYTPVTLGVADGSNLGYIGTGFKIQPNISGTVVRLEFTGATTVYMGEMELWGH